jgi:glycosyltransferase involved in cell wall biosynthesis
MFEPRVRKVRLKRLFDRTVARHVAARAAAVTVVSEHEARHVEAGGVPRTRIHVRGNPFPKPAAVSPNGSLRRLLGVDDAPIVLYVGRIAHGKGIELLLEALAEIPDAHLALVGPDDRHGMMTTVLAASSAPATAGRVHALGAVDDTLPLYADADVFVLPSEGESFGLVAAEAAAAGTPVVVTDRCGVAEFLGENGALVVPFERIALAAAIRRALDDGELRGRLRAGGRAAAERWSPDAVVARQEEIYRRALAP